MHDCSSIAKRLLVPAALLAVLACSPESRAPAQEPAASSVSTGSPASGGPSASGGAELDGPLRMAPDVTAGRLDNGLQYFVRRNDEPENRAFLRLVVDAGSVLEDDDARGAAHFLEHMAFNGTERFEKRELIDFMESIGMRLGVGLNALTSFDETVYMLSVPTDSPEPMRRAFEVLEDWAGGLTLDPDEIEQERGVVLEEWRGRQGASSRVQDRHLPLLFNGSRYAERLPIGTPQSISSLDRDVLHEFYRRWYRPELMAVVAVGDFEPGTVEALIREHFEDLPASSSDAPERAAYSVPTHDETLFSIVADPEVTTTTVQLVHKMPPDDDWTAAGYRRRLVERLYNRMLTLRLQELAREPDAPFLVAASEISRPIRASRLYSLSAVVPDEGIERGLASLVVESQRIERFGFTETELERAKNTLMREIERRHASRDDIRSSAFAARFTDAFLTNRPFPGIEAELALHERFVPGIELAEVNAVGRSWLGDTSRVVLVTAPEHDGRGVPDEAALSAVLNEAMDAEIERYVDTVVDGVLIDEPPEGSPVVAQRPRPGGLIEWDLENGVRVVLMPTDFSEDEVVFRGFSPGGASLASDEDLVAARTAAAVVSAAGLGELDVPALQRALTGKVAVANPFITDWGEGVGGRASTKDLETLFELIYLRFTAARTDADAFTLVKTQGRLGLQNRDRNPATAFADAFNRLMTQDHPRARPMTAEMLDEMDLQRSVAFYRERFADASDFTFVFVGAFDPAALRPLVERYIGGLPASGRDETWRDHGLRLPEGVQEETVRKGIEPRSQTRISFNGELDMEDRDERTLLIALARLLQSHLGTVLREELGGTYGVAVEPRIRWAPNETYAIVIEFASDPARTEELVATVFDEIEALKRAGAPEARLADVREGLLREHETNVRRNVFWLQALSEAYAWEKDPGAEGVLTHPERIAALTPDSVRTGFRRYLDTERYVRVTLMPEE